MTGIKRAGFINNNRKRLYCIVFLTLVTLLSGCADDNNPDGQDLYVDFCAVCHGLNNEGTLAFLDPNSIPPVIEQTEVGIVNALFDTPQMDTPLLNTLTLDEIRAIAFYLPTIGPDGQALFVTNCSSCHGVDNVGTGFASPIPDTNRADITIQNAIDGGITPMSIPSLEALKIGEISAITAYLLTLP